MKPLRIIIVGAGIRGTGYAMQFKKFPDMARVVAVADPCEFQRNRIATMHSIAPDQIFAKWEDVAELPRFADAVVVATQDEMHLEPALRFADLGYHILLEKPMAPRPHECQKIVDSAVRNNIIFAVCHVLRYTPYTRKMKQLLADGAVGQIVNLQHLEPVAYWHQAHSFVRGNWRREDESSSMLLSKSCHDLDWIRYIMDRPCKKISSFGSLFHFRSEKRPRGAGDNCLACDVEAQCPYSAKKIYIDRFDAGLREWPLNVLTPEMDRDKLVQAVATGPYGRCVYACDNDVVDNQVVNMQFEDGTTASFTMTAFTDHSHRKTRVFGTHGMLEGDGETIRVNNFLTDITTEHQVGASDASIVGEHGGGDYFLIETFIKALIQGDPTEILSGPKETLESHLMVFAAEEARKRDTVVDMNEFQRRFTSEATAAAIS